jgi:hypothetical protein
LPVITPTDHPADKPWASRRRHAGKSRKIKARLGHGFGDQPIEVVEMAAGGDLRHDAPVRPVLGELREDAFGQDPPLAIDHGDRRFIAAGFDPKDDHAFCLHSLRVIWPEVYERVRVGNQPAKASRS